MVVTRTINGPARLVFEAFSKPELFRQWWVPKSMGVTLLSCEMDVRVGGRYRLVFGPGAEFHGRYLEVTPPSRLVWTNEEGDEGGAVTTVTLEDKGDRTVVVMHDLYPSKEALDALVGMEAATSESLDQLEELVASLGREFGTAMTEGVK
jgi:uncharacterized protein YndB with AHSA1/START domain